jgi:hypothetical protein
MSYGFTMPRAKYTELPGHMAVLGLVIERPDQTVSYYAHALATRFSRARFAKPIAYSALRQMSEGRAVRVERTIVAAGEDRSLDRYGPTELGREVHRAWMYALPTSAPPIRDAIYGRIELARVEHLPQLIRIAHEEARIATDLFAETRELLRKHELKRGRVGVRGEDLDYVREIRQTLLYVDPLHWSSRASLYELIAQRLEEIAEKAGVDFVVPEESGLNVTELGDAVVGEA